MPLGTYPLDTQNIGISEFPRNLIWGAKRQPWEMDAKRKEKRWLEGGWIAEDILLQKDCSGLIFLNIFI